MNLDFGASRWQISQQGSPIDYNPCLECKLCVAACPVGAIGADRHFDFSACYTHNYREFLGGFGDWVENGHVGSPDLRVTADSRAWLGLLRQERSLVWALLTRKIRLNGSPRLLLAFGKCLPS